MKSIYLRNFVATAVMVSICFLIVAFSFVGIGRNYLISEYRDDMVNSAREVARTASAVAGMGICPKAAIAFPRPEAIRPKAATASRRPAVTRPDATTAPSLRPAIRP